MIYDIVIVASEKNYINIKYIYDSILKNITPEWNQIYCFCPSYPAEKIDGIEYVLDSEVLNTNISEIPFKPNWIYQQYMKLLQIITLDNYLIIDGDLIINKPINIFENDKPNFLFGNDANYSPFFNYSKYLFNIGREINQSFISEIMLFERKFVNELLKRFENKEKFIFESNKIINKDCFISEYELYGNFIYKNHKYDYNYKNIKYMENRNTLPWTIKSLEDYIEKYKSFNFDILSIP